MLSVLLAPLPAARVPGAALWLVVIPSEQYLTLSSREMQLALRHRLGLAPSDCMPARCACGHVLGPDPYHFHSCTFHRRRAVTTRHDMLVDFCEALGRDTGALVLAEDHSRDHDWPDLEFWTRGLADSGHIISDVSVVCPTAPSYRHNGRRRLACAEARSEAKRQRYATLATDAGADNLPAVFETFGGMSAATTSLLHRLISSHAVRPGVRTPRQFVRMIREGLSICLQRGNAMVDHMGLRWATHASSRLAPLHQLPSDSRRTRHGFGPRTGTRHNRQIYPGDIAIAVVSSVAIYIVPVHVRLMFFTQHADGNITL